MMRNKFVNKDWYAMNISRFVGESYSDSPTNGESLGVPTPLEWTGESNLGRY